MLTFLTSKIGGWVAAVAGVIAAIGTALLAARQSGKASAIAATDHIVITTIKEANDVQNQVAATPAADRRDQLQYWAGGQ